MYLYLYQGYADSGKYTDPGAGLFLYRSAECGDRGNPDAGTDGNRNPCPYSDRGADTHGVGIRKPVG